MKKIIHNLVILFISVFTLSTGNTEEYKSTNINYAGEHYEFTRKDIDEFKAFLNLSFDIMEEKRDLRYVVSSLDSRFKGGLIAPKKFWAPITKGNIIFTYFFREPTDPQGELYGFYASYFKKVNDREVWNINEVLLLPGAVVSSRFEKQDFSDLQLTFKQRFLLHQMPKNEWNNYSSTQYKDNDLADPQTLIEIEKGCYAIYRYERKENDVQLQVDFCEPKDYFQESHQNPAEFERIFIRRIFKEETGLYHWLKKFFRDPDRDK